MNTTLCYIKNDNDEILLLHRTKKENDLNGGKWIGVGGKFEDGETAEECVVREVFEETGLTLLSYHLHGVIKFVSDTWEDEDMYLFSSDSFSGTLKSECEEGELKWIKKDDVLLLPTWEGDRHFLKPLLEGRQNIDMLVQYEGDRLVKCEDLTEEIRTLKSPLIKCPHGFSTRRGGVSEGMYETLNLGMNLGDVRQRVTENWRRFLASCGIDDDAFVCGRQVHGPKVHIATVDDKRKAYASYPDGRGLIEADGYVTDCRDLPLAIFTADCVPLLLHDPVAGVIGAIHCGWRSTVADIEKNAVDAFGLLGSDASDIHAAIGPAIEKCCFEVGPEVISAVNDLIGDDASGFYTKKASGTSSEGKKYMLDLKGVVKKRLIMLGLDERNIAYVGGCTMCNPRDYFSHRGTKGNRGSLASVICLN